MQDIRVIWYPNPIGLVTTPVKVIYPTSPPIAHIYLGAMLMGRCRIQVTAKIGSSLSLEATMYVN